MFGMSAERNEVERTPRIDTGGTPARIDTGGTPVRIDTGGTPVQTAKYRNGALPLFCKQRSLRIV